MVYRFVAGRIAGRAARCIVARKDQFGNVARHLFFHTLTERTSTNGFWVLIAGHVASLGFWGPIGKRDLGRIKAPLKRSRRKWKTAGQLIRGNRTDREPSSIMRADRAAHALTFHCGANSMDRDVDQGSVHRHAAPRFKRHMGHVFVNNFTWAGEKHCQNRSRLGGDPERHSPMLAHSLIIRHHIGQHIQRSWQPVIRWQFHYRRSPVLVCHSPVSAWLFANAQASACHHAASLADMVVNGVPLRSFVATGSPTGEVR